MKYPSVNLSAPYVGQTAYEASVVQILQVADDVNAKTVTAFCQLGLNPSFKYWVPVMTPENYDPDWNNDTVVKAVQVYFVNPVDGPAFDPAQIAPTDPNVEVPVQ